jgi:hypothetical protein
MPAGWESEMGNKSFEMQAISLYLISSPASLFKVTACIVMHGSQECAFTGIENTNSTITIENSTLCFWITNT